MGLYVGAVCRLCRKGKNKLFLKGEKCMKNCVLDRGKRKNPPGQHVRMNMKVSEYGRHLIEKQKLKYIYGLGEKQLRNYFEIASNMKGLTGENLLLLLERRLDNVIRKLGYAASNKSSSQLINHKKVLVNGRIRKVPGYIVKIGDKIQVKDKMRENAMLKKSMEQSRILPSWLEFDKENFAGNVLTLPTRQDLSYTIDESLVVEFYSR